jgi:mannose-6-phosphate isomerase-like protein (cupin superfamily)
VQNWFSGETMTFRRTSADSAGELVELDLELRPLGAPGGAPHRHVVAERYDFTSGTAFVWIAGSHGRVVGAGDVVEVPPNRWHFIVALERTSATVSIRPGMRFDELLVEWAAIGRGDLRPKTIRSVIPLLWKHRCL